MIRRFIGTMTKRWLVKSVIKGVEMAFQLQNRYRYDRYDNYSRFSGQPRTTHVPIDTPTTTNAHANAIRDDMDYMDISDTIDEMKRKMSEKQNTDSSSDYIEIKPSSSPRHMQYEQGNQNVTSNASDATTDADSEPVPHDDDMTAKIKQLSEDNTTLKSQVTALQEKLTQAEEAQKKITLYAEHMKHDLSNYKRRSEEEQERKRAEAISDIGKALMPTIDDFERIIDHCSNGDEQMQSVASGCANIHKKLLSSLERLGIEQIDPTGEQYDPDIAMAMSHEEVDGVKTNTVFTTYQKGYKIGDKIIRSATVGVAK